jgi:hypothetical protein
VLALYGALVGSDIEDLFLALPEAVGRLRRYIREHEGDIARHWDAGDRSLLWSISDADDAVAVLEEQMQAIQSCAPHVVEDLVAMFSEKHGLSYAQALARLCEKSRFWDIV